MKVRSSVLGLILSAGLIASAQAQLVSPVPPAPAPTPEYTPPAPPPPPPQAQPEKPAPPAEPDLPPPELVARDGEGKLVLPTAPLDELAVKAIVDGSPRDESKTKGAQAIEDRRARMEQAVAKNALTAVQVRAKMNELDKVSGVKDVGAINTQIRALLVTPGVIDALQASSGFTPKELARARKAVENFRKAFNADLKAQAGDDPMKLIEPTMKGNLKLNWVEPSRVLEDLLGRLAPRWSDVRGTLGLTGEQTSAIAAGEADLAKAAAIDKADAMARVLSGLTASQATSAMLAVARPAPPDAPGAPAAPTPPAKPGVKTPPSPAPSAPPGKTLEDKK